MVHHDLRRDALREGEADEGAAGGVGADKRPLGVGLLYSLSGAVADDGDGVCEAAELTKIFEVVVHLLIGNDRKGEAHREFSVLVLFEYRLCVLAEVPKIISFYRIWEKLAETSSNPCNRTASFPGSVAHSG